MISGGNNFNDPWEYTNQISCYFSFTCESGPFAEVRRVVRQLRAPIRAWLRIGATASVEWIGSLESLWQHILPNILYLIFTARCTSVQSAVLRLHVVTLSVCPSVCQVKSSQVYFFSIAEQSTLLNYTTQNYTVKYTQLHTTSLYNKVHD